jgi:hypothetical protein
VKTKEAIILLNNLDVSGLKRKFRPKHSLIQVNRKGKIEAIYKFKSIPTEEQQIEALNKHPGTIQIPAMEDIYRNGAELKGTINKSMWLFDKMKKRQ